jgi:hypothetical protein
MDQERSLDIQRVTNAMDATRQSIQDTVDELKDRVQESADWRSYVVARPITSLIVAAACGVALARILVPAARLVRIPLLLAPRLIRRAPPTGLAATWSRVARAAGLVTEMAALPSLVSQFRGLVRSQGKKTRR